MASKNDSLDELLKITSNWPRGATPYPWSIQRRGDLGHNDPAAFTVIHGPGGTSDWVADVGYCDETSDHGSGSMSNAKLMAASPHMFMCLKEIIELASNGPVFLDADGLAIRTAKMIFEMHGLNGVAFAWRGKAITPASSEP